jgi:hypothetical protein
MGPPQLPQTRGVRMDNHLAGRQLKARGYPCGPTTARIVGHLR